MKKETKSEVATSHTLSQGPKKKGGIATEPLCSRGSPLKRENQKWLHCPFLLGGPKILVYFQGCPEKGTTSKVATSPMPSRGAKSEQNCFVTPSF